MLPKPPGVIVATTRRAATKARRPSKGATSQRRWRITERRNAMLTKSAWPLDRFRKNAPTVFKILRGFAAKWTEL
jgi:hypothetical protein